MSSSIYASNGFYGMPWMPRDDKVIRQYILTDRDKMLQLLPGRSLAACWKRAQKLKCLPRTQANWTAEEDAVLMDCKRRTADINEVLMLVPNRTPGACTLRINKLVSMGALTWAQEDFEKLHENDKKRGKPMNELDQPKGERPKDDSTIQSQGWTRAEEEILRQNVGKNFSEYAHLLPGRTAGACRAKRERMGLNTQRTKEERPIQQSQQPQQMSLNMPIPPSQALVDYEQQKQRSSMIWSKEDDGILSVLFNQNRGRMLSCLPGRTLMECWARAIEIGAAKPSNAPWSSDEETKLFKMKDDPFDAILAFFPSRAPQECVQKLNRLIESCQKDWTDEDNAKLLECYDKTMKEFERLCKIALPHRMLADCNTQIKKLQRNRKMQDKEVVQEEDNLPISLSADKKEEYNPQPSEEEPPKKEPVIHVKQGTYQEIPMSGATKESMPQKQTELKKTTTIPSKKEKAEKPVVAAIDPQKDCNCKRCMEMEKERSWRQEEISFIKNNYDKPFPEISQKMPDRSCMSCYHMATNLLRINKNLIHPSWTDCIERCWNLKTCSDDTPAAKNAVQSAAEPWGASEDSIIRQTYRNTPETTVHMISSRSREELYHRAVVLGVIEDNPNARKWTKEEDAIIERDFAQKGIDEVVKELGFRSEDQVMKRAKSMGLMKKYSEPEADQSAAVVPVSQETTAKTHQNAPAWTEEELNILKHHENLSVSELKKFLPARSESSISTMRSKILHNKKAVPQEVKEGGGSEPAVQPKQIEKAPVVETPPTVNASVPGFKALKNSLDSITWTPEEDQRLIRNKYRLFENYKELFPNRSKVQCMYRLRVLLYQSIKAPNVLLNKNMHVWTPEEDLAIILNEGRAYNEWANLLNNMDEEEVAARAELLCISFVKSIATIFPIRTEENATSKWTREEDKMLKAMWNGKDPVPPYSQWGAKFPDKSKTQCLLRICELIHLNEKKLLSRDWTMEEDKVLIENESRAFRDWKKDVPERGTTECRKRAAKFGVKFDTVDPSYPSVPVSVNQWTWNEIQELEKHIVNNAEKWFAAFAPHTKADCCIKLMQVNFDKLSEWDKGIRTTWHPGEDAVLFQNEGVPFQKWGKLIPTRSKAAVMSRMRALGIKGETKEKNNSTSPVKVWSAKEDETIRANQSRPFEFWKDNIPNRTYAECAKRATELGFKLSVSEQTEWTEAEDAIILQYKNEPYQTWGNLLPRKTFKECMERRKTILNLDKNSSPKWTKEEDEIILQHNVEPFQKWSNLLPAHDKEDFINHAVKDLHLTLVYEDGPWTPDEIIALKKAYRRPIEDVPVILLDRSASGCIGKLNSLGIKKKAHKSWSDATMDEKVLKQVCIDPTIQAVLEKGNQKSAKKQASGSPVNEEGTYQETERAAISPEELRRLMNQSNSIDF